MADSQLNLIKEITEKVDRSSDEVFHTLQELVRIPSVVGREGQAQEWVARLFGSLGLHVERVVPGKENLVNHPAYTEIGLPYNESRPNIVGIYPGTGSGNSLILNGHIDVVPPEPIERWEGGNPWSGKIEGNRLYGRGSADMKSGLLANFFSLKVLLELGLKPSGKIILESVIEEEAGGSGGTLALLMAGFTADVMVIPEPLNLKIITAHPGVNYFRVKVYGKTAHAGQSHMGVNAIGKLAKIYDRLVELDRKRAETNRDPFFERWTGRSCNLNIGTFKAGDWVSTVPGQAVLEARISYLPRETETQMKEEVEKTIAEVARQDEWLAEHPPQVEWFGWRAKPWVQDPEAAPLVRFRRSAAQILSYTPDTIASTAGLDTRFCPYFNIPSFVFGPVGGLLHSANEYVELDSVIQTIKVLSAFIIDWCGIQ